MSKKELLYTKSIDSEMDLEQELYDELMKSEGQEGRPLDIVMDEMWTRLKARYE